ncbi:MAG: trypsin-like peptidase domain-containing protein [Anaerolineae bacterium]
MSKFCLWVLLGLSLGWLAACSTTPNPDFPATVQAGVLACQAAPAIAHPPRPLSRLHRPPRLFYPTSTPTLTPTPAPPTASQIFEQISPAVAFIDTPGGSGSGLLTPDGYVVTNAHVVWPFEKVRVVFADGSEHLEAPVLGWDLLADLAVVGPLETSLKPVNFSQNEKLTVGSDIYLVGYPGEVDKFPQPTMTRGILSRLREWTGLRLTYFQVDAPATGGQSGGVLVTSQGEVVGVSNFSFTEAKFALVAAAADLLPRLKHLLDQDDGFGFSDRRILAGAEQSAHTIKLQHHWDSRAYIINQPANTPVDISVEGDNQPRFDIFDLFGQKLVTSRHSRSSYKAESFTTELAVPYFVEVYQAADTPGEVKLNSSQPLSPLSDPDDGVTLTAEQSLTGNIDYPGDVDYFVLDLEEGQTVKITADSLLVDPLLMVDFIGAAEKDFISDDNSGGGIFGSNAELIYRAPQEGSYFIVVRDSRDEDVGGYFLNLAPAPEEATPTPPQLAANTQASPYGRMTLYKSRIFPFSMPYPAYWSEPDEAMSLCQAATACFTGADDGTLIIKEEDLPSLGVAETTLAKYVDATLAALKSQVADFKLIAREDFTNLQGQPAQILTYTSQGGLFKASQLVYVYEDSVGFSVTYLTGAERYQSLESFIYYSFDSFRLRELGPEAQDAVYYYDQGLPLLSDNQAEAAVDSFTQAIELDPDFIEAYYKRASAYRQQSQFAKALADHDKTIELSPDDPTFYEARALTHWLGADYPQALSDMDQTLRLAPQFADAYNLRALIQATQGNYDQALTDVNKAIGLQPSANAPFLDTRGYIYLKMERYDQAQADFEEIFNQGLHYPSAFLGGGLTYAALGDNDKAIEWLNQGLERVRAVVQPDPQLADLIALAQQKLVELETKSNSEK